MGLHAHLIQYYFVIATLSAETAGGFAGPLSRVPLFATSSGSLGRMCVLPMSLHVVASQLQQ